MKHRPIRERPGGRQIRYQLALLLAIVATGCAVKAQTEKRTRSVSTMVFTAFPEAETVRHIVRDIDRSAREKIEKALPFRVHFEELGEHKLHVAFRGNKPVGLLYVRSERTEWGLAEIGWALSLDGRVLGFEFASGRSAEAKALPTSAFAKSLIGRDFRDLHILYEAQPRPVGEVKTSGSLARTVLRSALKATLVTKLVWHDQIAMLADTAMLYDELPGARPGKRRVVKLEPRADRPRRLETLHVIEALGQANSSLGRVVRTKVRIGDDAYELRWVIDARQVIVRVSPSASWPNEMMRLACGALRGKPITNPGLPDNPLTPIARELAEELLRIRWSRRWR